MGKLKILSIIVSFFGSGKRRLVWVQRLKGGKLCMKKLQGKVRRKKANLARVWVRTSSTMKGTTYLIEYDNDQSKSMILYVIQL